MSSHFTSLQTSWILIGSFTALCGRSFSSHLLLSENPWNSTDIQTRRKTCTMMRLCCVLFIIVFILQVCAATDKEPRIGKTYG